MSSLSLPASLGALVQFSQWEAMDIERKVVTLVQHFLHERGWSLALAALEEDSQIRFEAHTLPSGAHVSLVTERDAEAAARELAALSLRTKYGN